MQPGLILYFGLIRPYKGVDGLIEEFTSWAGPELRLRLVGKPLDQQLRSVVESATQMDPRISAHLAFVEDHVLVQEVTAAEMVVLPYREMHNSGALLVALSLERPVIAPQSDVNRLLSQEVGPGWLYLYEGNLEFAFVEKALSTFRSTPPSNPPALEGRSWPVIGRRHHQAYLLSTELVAR